MRSKAFDVALILISGIIAFIISSYNPRADKAEMDALWLYIIPATVIVAAILIFIAFSIFFKPFYNRYRWWIAGILVLINLLSGIFMYYYQLPN
jgi:hypothetical protein